MPTQIFSSFEAYFDGNRHASVRGMVLGPEREDWVLTLVNENVTIGEKQDALLVPSLPQPPDDLKGSVSLAGACGHHEKDTILTLRYRFDRCVDGIALVITRGFPARVVEVVLQDNLFFVGGQSFPCPILLP